MKCILTFSCVFICFCIAFSNGISVCYWGSWANIRQGLGRFGISDLPVHLCTHIIYSFIGITAEGDLTFPEEWVIEGKSNNITDLMALRESNSELKLIVAIGGWIEGSVNYSIVANNETLRARFVSNIVEYLEVKGFDGLDFDWEYPGQRGGIESDKEAFVELLRDLKAAFEPRNWLLTVAVGVTQYNIDLSYDVRSINDIVDYIHLMTYDFSGSWNNVTGVHTPLYADGDVDELLNVDNSVKVWVSNGASYNKLVLGLAIYGRSFTLASLEDTGVGAASLGGGDPGDYTGGEGELAYYEICLHQMRNEWNITTVKGNYEYGHSGRLWVSYDSPNTIRDKAAYARDHNMAGIMFWSVDLDDFHGLCSNETFPIIRNAVEAFNTSAGAVHSAVRFVTLVCLSIRFLLGF